MWDGTRSEEKISRKIEDLTEKEIKARKDGDRIKSIRFFAKIQALRWAAGENIDIDN